MDRHSKCVAIVQSNYIPWKGYFDLMRRADEFVLYDDVQYTRRDWRNRNRIKTSSGTQWLTIPVQVKGKYHQTISQTLVSDRGWARRHWRTLQHAYKATAHFSDYEACIASLYESAADLERLSDINRLFLDALRSMLGVETQLSSSAKYDLVEGKTERLVEICRQAGATSYLSGPSARIYLDENRFTDAHITVEYMDYTGYPEYPQLHPPFEHAVSAVDLLFNTGPNALTFLARP